MLRYSKPCLDASVFIGGLDREICNRVRRGVVFDHIWRQATAGNFTVYISAIAIAEVFKKRHRQCGLDHVKNMDEFLKKIDEPFVEVIEVDREIALEANELCRVHGNRGLRPNDALHLASARRASCDVLLAWDSPLVGVGVANGVRIEEPAIYDRDMFTEDESATEVEEVIYKKWQNRRRQRSLAPHSEAAHLPGSGNGSPDVRPATEED